MNNRSAGLQLGPLRKRNLFAQVVEELGLRIVRGDLNPDEPFPKEADLEAEFGVSRSVVRRPTPRPPAAGITPICVRWRFSSAEIAAMSMSDA